MTGPIHRAPTRPDEMPELPPSLPFDKPDLFALAPLMRKMQEETPVAKVRMKTGDEAWLVTRYDDVRALLTDTRLCRSTADPREGVEKVMAAMSTAASIDTEHEDRQHARMRALLVPCMSARRLGALTPHVTHFVDDLLDQLVRRVPPVDLNEALAIPLPTWVICKLLGLPEADRTKFRRWSLASLDTHDTGNAQQALAAIVGYMLDVIAAKRAVPGDDVISQLIAADGGSLDDQAIAGLAAILLIGGHETTVRRIGIGTLLLLRNPDQWAALVADPGLVPAAVEEILRLSLMTGRHGDGFLRYARADIEIGGATINAGDTVILAAGAANRDKTKFGPSADELDVTRHGPSHFDFAYGPWFCVGAPLARIELVAVFERLVAEFPTMRLAISPQDIEWQNGPFTRGPKTLPVTW